MQYNLQLDRDTAVEVVVKQLTSVPKNTKLPLTLFGQGRPNYGQDLQNNFFYLLENFCGEDAPSNPAVGMLWYDSALKYLKLYTGETYPRGPWVKVDLLTTPSQITPSLSSNKSITWSSTGFFESTANTGIIIGYLWANISGATFKTNLVNGVDYTISNVPTGLIPKVDSTSTDVAISFTGAAPLYNLNTATIKVSFNISAFDGLSGNVADIIGNYTHDSTITFIPPSTITPEFTKTFNNLLQFTLKDATNKVYTVLIDTNNYGSYVVYDDTKTITDNKTLIDLNNTLGNYGCVTIPNNLVISSDNTYFSQVCKLSPKNVGTADYKCVKYTVTPNGTLFASVDTSLDVTATDKTIRIDDNHYITNYIFNGINATQLTIYNSTAKTSANYPSTALAAAEYSIIDNPSKGFYLKPLTFINSDYDVIYTGINDSSQTINYYLTNKNYSIFNLVDIPSYKSNAKLPKTFVSFSIDDNVLKTNFHNNTTKLLTKSDTIGTSNIPTTAAGERFSSGVLKSFAIVDVMYCGHNTNNTADIYGVVLVNNNKNMAAGYQVAVVEVKHTSTALTDITVTFNPISTYSTNSLLLNITNPPETSLYKVFYDDITKAFGLFYKG